VWSKFNTMRPLHLASIVDCSQLRMTLGLSRRSQIFAEVNTILCSCLLGAAKRIII